MYLYLFTCSYGLNKCLDINVKVREYRRAIKHGQSRETGNIEYTRRQSRETGNIEYTRRRQTKQEHNTICVGQHYRQTHINSVNKKCTLLQTSEGKDELNIGVCGNRNGHNNTELRT